MKRLSGMSLQLSSLDHLLFWTLALSTVVGYLLPTVGVIDAPEQLLSQ